MTTNAMHTEVLIFILCGLYLVTNGQECLPNPEDVASMVGRSPIVLEGRVEEIQPSAFQDEGLVDAVVSIVTVFKGQLDSETSERIVVGPFGASGSVQTCVGEARSVGEELVLFLDAPGQTSAELGVLRRFRLMANPIVADSENRRVVEQHAPPSLWNAHATLCAETGYCLNGGTCYVMPALGRRFCKCPQGFKDNRCQEKQTGMGETKMLEDYLIKDYFFLIIIGTAAVVLALMATCIFLVFFVRCRPLKTKNGKESSGVLGIEYRKVTSTDPENTIEKDQVSSAQSNVEVQTDPTNGVSRRRSDNVNDRYHSNGGRKLRTNGTTAEDSAKLHRPLKPQDVRESSSHRGRTGPLKTQVPPGPVESSRNVVSSSPRGVDLQDHRGSDYSSNGVWISRPWGDEGSTLRGQRLDSVDSIPV